jgi:glucose 1-dehydrogenase
MKAILLKPHTQTLHIENVEEPQIKRPYDVKMKVLQVGICGTDREEASGGRADAPKGETELIIGHEMTGLVIEVGPKVQSVRPGDHAVISVRRGCNRCLPCKEDCYDLCETGLYTERGIKELHGFQSEFVLDEEKYVFKVPPLIKEIAVLTEPTTVVEKAIEVACRIQTARLPGEKDPEKWLTGKNVLVAGLGPIGLLAAMVLSIRGAKVWGLDVVDPNSARPTILKGMGGRYIKSSESALQNFSGECKQLDMVLEAAGIAKLNFDLMKLLGNNGIYALTGVPGNEKPFTVDGGPLMCQMVLKNQVIVGSVNASLSHFKKAIDDLEKAEKTWKGLIQKLITSRTPYSRFEKAIHSHTPNEIKAIIEWRS